MSVSSLPTRIKLRWKTMKEAPCTPSYLNVSTYCVYNVLTVYSGPMISISWNICGLIRTNDFRFYSQVSDDVTVVYNLVYYSVKILPPTFHLVSSSSTGFYKRKKNRCSISTKIKKILFLLFMSKRTFCFHLGATKTR